jgi:dTDP-4-amino-4,6-dideoxygalactose transaminase
MHDGVRPIAFAKPYLGEEEVEAARAAILSGWVTQGPRVAAFEAAFAEAVGAPFACAVSSGTAALHLALLGVGVEPGDEVVTVSHSFIATANAVRYCGATPVFVDIDPASYNIDPEKIADAITPKTRALLCVHQLGMPCDMAAILRIAEARGVKVVEDAACASGSEIAFDGRFEQIGRPRGDAACFSFHPRKVITTGDGGMITTRNGDYDARFRLLRQHGMDLPDTVRHSARAVVFERYLELGFNYRMTDIQAAIGVQQLRRLPGLVASRRDLAAHYNAALSAIAGVKVPVEPRWARSNWQSYAIRLPAGVDQRAVMQTLLERGVSSRRGVMCAHREAPYMDVPRPFSLPHSEQAQDQVVLLPMFSQMTAGEIDYVVDAVSSTCR